MDVNSALFKKKCRVRSSLRYELFLAMGALLEGESELYLSWRRQALSSMSTGLAENFRLLGSAKDLWPLFATILPVHKIDPSVAEIVADLQSMELTEFQARTLEGVLHDEPLSRRLCLGTVSLKEAINAVAAKKREWLAYMGLYPHDRTQPFIAALELLVSHPEVFRRLVLESVQLFWDDVFAAFWRASESKIERSVEATEKLCSELPFEEFAERKLLRVTFTERGDEILALRGGYRLPVKEIEACVFIPSAFNERRLWSSLKAGAKKSFVYFPYFEPSLALSGAPDLARASIVKSDLDPALIFKALGDSTRFGIVSLLKVLPKTATELADELGLSKATVSHHLSLLREAGVIRSENAGSRNAALRLDDAVIESISSLYVQYLNNRTKRRR